ncbi:MAG: diguanylate cyclase [Deferribacteres bacterium]|nr:diguanylate cyclase [Deferribacteres bacterium]
MLPRSESNKIKEPVRYLLTVGLIALQVVTVAAILIASRASTEKVLLDHMKQIMTSVVTESIDRTEEFLAPAEKAAHLTRNLAKHDVVSAGDTGAMELYFFEQLRVNPQFAGIYFGFSNGAFVYVKHDNGGYLSKLISIDGDKRMTEFIRRDASFKVLSRWLDPDDTYDPRSRPWFRRVRLTRKLIWTDPYVFYTSRLPGVTTAAPVFGKSGKITGVIGVDIEITDISRFLGGLRIGKNGSAFIFDREGNLVAFPDMDKLIKPATSGARELRLARVSEIEDPVVRAAYEKLGDIKTISREQFSFVSFQAGGAKHNAIFAPFGAANHWSWIIAVHAPEDDFLGPIRRNQRRNLLLAIAVGIAACILAIPLSFSVTRPLRALHERANRDELTGLPNRRYLLEIASKKIAGAVRNRSPVAVAMLDLDNFKLVNDTCGHGTGDEVLRGVAERLSGALREGDIIGRYGGEEFAIILPDTGLSMAREIAERLRASIAASPLETSLRPVGITASIGIVSLVPVHTDVPALLDAADKALLQAKRAGRNCVRVSDISEEPGAVQGGNEHRHYG